MAVGAEREALLGLWHRVLRTAVAGPGPDLTSRQLALLLTVYLEPPPHTVRALARSLGISKPAVVRAIDALTRLDFARRRVDDADRRSVLVHRTVKGAVFLSEFAETIEGARKEAMG